MFRETRRITVVSQACMFSTFPGVLVANPTPGFLECVVDVGNRTEHPVGDRARVRPVLLKALGQPLPLVHHQLTSPAARLRTPDDRAVPDQEPLSGRTLGRRDLSLSRCWWRPRRRQRRLTASRAIATRGPQEGRAQRGSGQSRRNHEHSRGEYRQRQRR